MISKCYSVPVLRHNPPCDAMERPVMESKQRVSHQLERVQRTSSQPQSIHARPRSGSDTVCSSAVDNPGHKSIFNHPVSSGAVKPQNIELQKRLPSDVHELTVPQQDKSSDYIDVRNAIEQTYGIAPSKWQRKFAPSSGNDTARFPDDVGGEELKFDPLLNKLMAYAKANNIEIPKNVDVSKVFVKGGFVGVRGEPVIVGCQKEAQAKLLIEKIVPDLFNLSVCGAHGYGHSYSDEDILRVHSPDPRKVDDYNFAGVYRQYFNQVSGKHTILQLATRGCSAAVTGMLILDKGGKIDMDSLETTNLGNGNTRRGSFVKAGFDMVESKSKNLAELKRDIEKYGPAIVSVNSGIGGHVVIVDAITDNAITVRDPAHGWMVDIKPEALNKRGEHCLHIGKRLATADKK